MARRRVGEARPAGAGRRTSRNTPRRDRAHACARRRLREGGGGRSGDGLQGRVGGLLRGFEHGLEQCAPQPGFTGSSGGGGEPPPPSQGGGEQFAGLRTRAAELSKDRPKTVPHPRIIEGYLRNLVAILDGDRRRARDILAKHLSQLVLTPGAEGYRITAP